MIEHCQEQCLPDHEHTVQTQLDSFSRSETLCTTGEATEKQSAGWAAHWHGPATVIGLQHESLWLAHRTTSVKCSKGHVRHATASEQVPLGPMLHTLRAPPVPPGRDMRASEDLFMDLDEQPNAHVTRRAALSRLTSTIRRVCAKSSNPLPRTPGRPVPSPRDTLPASATWISRT